MPPHSIPLKIHVTVIPYHTYIFISWAVCEYIQSTDWLATGYVIDQTWKDRSLAMSTPSETNLRSRTLPSENACRCRLDGMGTA